MVGPSMAWFVGFGSSIIALCFGAFVPASHKTDGVECLDDVWLVGTTNREDMLRSRPGRLEVQAETSLPDENGRLQILQIHTDKMKENYSLAFDVNLQQLAARTKNYSGAELEGVVKNAVSYALDRKLTRPVQEENIKVTMKDFLKALQEITPALGVSTDDLEKCRSYGMVDCDRHKQTYGIAMRLVEEVKGSKDCPIGTCLLEGPSGSGKTALAATIAIHSDFPFAKLVSAQSMIGLHEDAKCAEIDKVFKDAYKSPLSVIILDDIERLLEYAPIGPLFSNPIMQTLRSLLERAPPKRTKLMVIGTTSELYFLDSVEFSKAFSVICHVPTLNTNDAKKVLEQSKLFLDEDIDSAAEASDGVPISELYTVIGMARQAINPGEEKINISHFHSIFQEVVNKAA